MVVKRLDRLTSEQAALLPRVRDEWVQVALSTAPADRADAEAGVTEAYRAAGLEEPRQFVWLESPWAGAIAAATAPTEVGDQVMAQVAGQLRDQVRNEVRAQVGPQVRALVRTQVGAQVMAQLGALLGDQVMAHIGLQLWEEVGDQVRAVVTAQLRDREGAHVMEQVGAQVSALVAEQLRAAVGPQVWSQVGDQFKVQVGPQVWDQLRARLRDQVGAVPPDRLGPRAGEQAADRAAAQGVDRVIAEAMLIVRAGAGAQVEAHVRTQVMAPVLSVCYEHYGAAWLSFYDFFARLGGVGGPQRLSALIAVARSTGWWWAFRDVAILTERPVVLHRDSLGRLHCPDGMALEYPDGWGIYAWHGLRMPARVILDPRSLTVEQIRDEPNAEVRRVMLERFGQERYLRESGARLVHKDDWGELYRADMLGDEPLQMVKVVNSTPEPDGSLKDYWLRVPPTVRTAHEAVSWTFNKSPNDYQPAAET